MALSERIPGMRPGSTIRNVALGAVYLFAVMVVLGAVVDDPDDNAADIEVDVPDSVASAEEGSGDTDGGDSDGSDEQAAGGESENDTDPPDTDAESESVDSEAEEAEQEQAARQAAGPIVLESTLVDAGIDVHSVGEQGSTLHVEYVGYDASQEAIARDIGGVAGAYAGITSGGYESDRMEVTLRGADGSLVGTYYAESEWAQAYMDGEISDAEYATRVFETIEVND